MRNEPRRYEDRNCPRDRRDIGEKKKKKKKTLVRHSLSLILGGKIERLAKKAGSFALLLPLLPPPKTHSFATT